LHAIIIAALIDRCDCLAITQPFTLWVGERVPAKARGQEGYDLACYRMYSGASIPVE